MTPGLPFVPAIAVTVNIYLIFKLSYLTLVRFTLWMIVGKFDIYPPTLKQRNNIYFLTKFSNFILGLIVYFKYGIKNSTLEQEIDEVNAESNQNIELTIPKAEDYQTVGPYEPPPPSQDYSSSRAGLFVNDPTAYATWDD